MSERLRQLGGTLQILSNETGMEVRATVPLQDLPSATTVSL
jgi:signal transduction histidine kinase